MDEPTTTQWTAIKTDRSTVLNYKATIKFNFENLQKLKLNVKIDGEGKEMYGKWKDDLVNEYSPQSEKSKSIKGVCSDAKKDDQFARYRVKYTLDTRASSI